MDLTAIDTSITEAVGDASSVGGFVVAGIATLIVVGLVITMLKKLG